MSDKNSCVILEMKEFAHYPNEIGKQVDYLKILDEIESVGEYPIYYICECKCGKEVIRERRAILYNHGFKSCGCYRTMINKIGSRPIKHGSGGYKNGKRDKLYRAWVSMRQRCNNPNDSIYKWYGAKGINVCKEWDEFKDFRKWAMKNGYKKGFLRTSVVSDPINRVNTGDNTPPVIHYDIIEGNELKIHVMPKGFGSENMSAVKMLKPSDGIDGVRDFIEETVDKAGPNPCPPIVVGVGIGGTMEKAAFLAKKALLRPVNQRNANENIRQLEEEMLGRINALGIGPAGLGGRLTAMAVNIDIFPTHIAGLPVAVNISCHVTRHAEAVL
jgi:tartrate/fumarate subfamily iron-sulfur-dependent hydro-lyase alpha chain